MDSDLPPMNAVKAFVAAAEELSFSRAGEILHVTPGAISRQVQVLEQWLGTALFVRRTRQVELTPVGQSFFEAARPALQQIAAAGRRARARRLQRPISIVSYPTFALRWLVPRWGRFYDRHPQIDVQLTTSLAPVDFERDSVDAAIRVGPAASAWPGCEALALAEVELTPVASPSLLSRQPLDSPDDLARHTLLHGAPRPDDWPRWLQAAGVRGIDASGGVTFDTLNLVIQAAIGGVGVAIGIGCLVAEDLAAGRLVAPLALKRRSTRHFHLVWPKENADDPRLKAFADWLRDEVAAAPMTVSDSKGP